MKIDSGVFDTAPPKEAGLIRLKAGVSRAISSVLMPLIWRAARNHVGGQTIADALCAAQRLKAEGYPCTLGLWDSADCTQKQVAGHYLEAVQYLISHPLDAYLSLKPPALRYDTEAALELAAAAKAGDVRLHFDSHGPEAASASNAMLDAMIRETGPERLGTTIPGRWARSLMDADWAIERGLRVRVVKGQWPDPSDPNRDMRAGFLGVIDRLAGRVPHVAVATHDMPLAMEAISRLRAAGTSLELEQILGLTAARSLRWAKENGVRLRVYVPYGKGYIPNALGTLRRNPRLALHIAGALMRGG